MNTNESKFLYEIILLLSFLYVSLVTERIQQSGAIRLCHRPTVQLQSELPPEKWLVQSRPLIIERPGLKFAETKS